MSRSSTTRRPTHVDEPMRYRVLGRTELQISIVGFGSSPLGDVFGVTDPQEGERAVQMAVDEGINFFDVSPYYGYTLAEERLGSALIGRRDRVILATKCGRYGSDQFDFSPARVQTSIEESLRRLRTDHVDLLLAHDIEFGDLQQIVGETIPAMRRLQEQGKARYIGISAYPLKPLLRVAGEIPVDAILSYCHYDLLADDLDAVLAPFAESNGIGLINASPLHMGVLTQRGGPGWHPAPKNVQDASQHAAEFCRDHGMDISELALQFCFGYPRVGTTLVGMASQEQVRSSLRAFETPADPQIVHRVRAILAPVLNVVWPSGRAENQ